MRNKFLKVWAWTRTKRQKSRPGMSRTTRLVIRYKLVSTFLFVTTGAAFQGSPQPAQNPMPEARAARAAMVQAIEEDRLVSPAGNSAWDHYQSYVRYPLGETERHEADDQMVIARGSAGDRILAAYRHGDQVISMHAASYAAGARLFGYAGEVAQRRRVLRR